MPDSRGRKGPRSGCATGKAPEGRGPGPGGGEGAGFPPRGTGINRKGLSSRCATHHKRCAKPSQRNSFNSSTPQGPATPPRGGDALRPVPWPGGLGARSRLLARPFKALGGSGGFRAGPSGFWANGAREAWPPGRKGGRAKARPARHWSQAQGPPGPWGPCPPDPLIALDGVKESRFDKISGPAPPKGLVFPRAWPKLTGLGKNQSPGCQGALGFASVLPWKARAKGPKGRQTQPKQGVWESLPPFAVCP